MIHIPVLTETHETAGNPGDVFICMGMQYLFEQAFGGPLPWLKLCKFNKEDVFKYREMLKQTGYIIYAGTPQYNNYDDWCKWYDWGIWEDLILPDKLQYVSIAGGGGLPDPSMTATKFASYCASSKLTADRLRKKARRTLLTTVRDPCASALLSKLQIAHEMLPCTATWAAHYTSSLSEPGDRLILIPPSSEMMPREHFKGNKSQLAKDFWTQLYKDAKAAGHKPLLCFHNLKDAQLFADEQHIDSIYANTATALLNIYKQSAGVITGRLHGALPIYGMGGRKAVLGAIDTRASAGELLRDIQTTNLATATPGKLLELYEQATPSNPQEMQRHEAAYIQLLRNKLAELPGLGNRF